MGLARSDAAPAVDILVSYAHKDQDLCDQFLEHLSGLRVGLAPLEDFAYPLCAAFLVPAVFTLLPARVKARA